MNPELKTTEYVSKLKDIKLSDGARTRIADNLQAYATFHAVRGGEENRFISDVPVTTSTSLLSLRYSFMPLLVILAVFIGGSTTFAAQNALPGDFLYPVKTEFNENIRTALAFSADSEAKVQTALLEERIEEAQALQAEGKLTAETATLVSTTINNQFVIAAEASAKSSERVAAETNWRAEKAMTTFLAFGETSTDTAIAAKVSTAMQGSELATGVYSITAYQADMEARTTALKNILVKYKSKLNTSVHTELTTKITTATTLTIEAKTQAETDARVTLDKAATLAGEVESKLSTLGQVEIDPSTGIIADIDFSIDPMKINRGDGEVQPQTIPSNQGNSNSGVGVQSETSVDTSIETEVVETPVEVDASARSGAGVGL